MRLSAVETSCTMAACPSARSDATAFKRLGTFIAVIK